MVQDRQFELYIGEMKLYNNNDLSPFWTGSARYGLAVTQQLLDAYALMRADSAAAPDFERAFAGQMPYIPPVVAGRGDGVQPAHQRRYFQRQRPLLFPRRPFHRAVKRNSF